MAVIISSECSFAQTTAGNKSEAKKSAVKDMVDSQRFVFVAQSVTPLRGGFRNITSDYDVTISKDTMVSYLPYFGRATVAPLDPAESALSFTSTNFSYTVTPRKKNGWDVAVKPYDKTDIQQFLFTIFDNGTASLNVTSIARDNISFSGYIKKAEKKRKKKKE